MDKKTHSRFINYLELFRYFGQSSIDGPPLTFEEFSKADAEYRDLVEMKNQRDDDDEARFVELQKVLFRD